MIALRDGGQEFSYTALFGWSNICPSKLELTQLGKRYYDVMGLDDIPEEDIRNVALYLS